MKNSVLAPNMGLTIILGTLFTLLLNPLSWSQGDQHDHHHYQRNESDIIANEGQWPANLNAYSATSGGAVYFASDRLHFDLFSGEDLATVAEQIHAGTGFMDERILSFPVRKHYYQLKLVGAATGINPVFEEEKRNVYHFFLGDRSTWRSNVKTYSHLKYTNVYDGVDVLYKMHGAELKYDFIVAPGKSPDIIRLQYDGVSNLRIADGQLVITTSVGEQREYIPLAYQKINGKCEVVACEYRLEGTVVSFVFPDGYNDDHPLVIDPQLIGSTNSGSTATIYGHTATYDDDGNMFVGGNGFAPGGLPTTPGAYQITFGGGNDMALNKYGPDGTQLLFSTYLGGSGMDLPHSMITDANNDLYVLGSTQSGNFPVTAGAAQTIFGGGMSDICVSHFSASGGTMIGSTYIGGSSNDGTNMIYVNYGDTYRGEINLAQNGDVLVASFTQSANFPVTSSAIQTVHGGSQDGAAIRLNNNLSAFQFVSYMGGTTEDACYGILESPDGTIYVSGALGSNAFTFPGSPAEPQFTTSGGYEAFVARIAANGQSLVNGTYIGNYGSSEAFFVQLNSSNHVLVATQTANGIAATAGKYQGPGNNMAIIQYTEDLSQREWVSSIANMAPSAFLVDNCNRIYLSGHGLQGNYDITPGALFNTPNGFYLMQLNETATTLVYGTYFGNGGSHVDGGTSRFDKNGIVYQATCSAGTFPSGPSGSYSGNNNGGSYDMTVFKIDFEPNPQPFILPDQEIFVCDGLPQAVPFTGANAANVTHHWWFGDGGTSSEQNPTHTFTAFGDYEVQYYPEFQEGCSVSDTVVALVHILEAEPFDLDYTFIQGSCNDTLFIGLDFTGTADSISWNMGDGIILNDTDPFEYYYAASGQYTITLYAEDTICSRSATETIVLNHLAHQGVGELFMPNVFTNNNDGIHDLYHISAAGYTMSEVFNDLVYYSVQIVNRWGNPVFESDPDDPQTWPWDGKVSGKMVDEGVYFYLVKYKTACMTEFEEKDGFVQVVR